MVKQGRIAQYRERLDRTLASPDLTDDEALTALVKDQILRSQDHYDKDQGQVNDSLSTRVAESSNLLGMFRSVSDSYATSPNERSHSSWKLKSDSEELRVMYREGPLGSPFHTLLVEGYVDAPVDACLCVSWETAIYKTWFPEAKIPTFKVTTAKCLQKIRDNEHISLVRMKLSWPLTDREAVLHYFEFEYFKDDLVIVVISSVPDGESILYESKGCMDDESAEAGQTIRVDYIGGFALQKVTEGRSYFRTIANLDIKLDFVPPSLINFISRQLIGSSFRLYQKSVTSISDGNKIFGKVMSDPLYKRIREGIYSKGKPNDDQENKFSQGDMTTEPAKQNQTARNEHPDEDTADTEASSSEYKDMKISPNVKKHEVNDNKKITESGVKRREVQLSPPVEEALGTLEKIISAIRSASIEQQTLGEASDRVRKVKGEDPSRSLTEDDGIGSGSGSESKSSDNLASSFGLCSSPTEPDSYANEVDHAKVDSEAAGKDLSSTANLPPLASHPIINGSKKAPNSGKNIEDASKLIVDAMRTHDETKPSEKRKKSSKLRKKLSFSCLGIFSSRT
ncbi:hypothetical protein Drorol1_Dr00014424 [Drosera rotundifolia]